MMGFAFLIPVLIEYFKTGLVLKMPSFLTSVFFFISSIQSFFGGLILQTMMKNKKQEFKGVA